MGPSVREAVLRVGAGELSCEEHVASRLERMPRMDRDVHAFLHVAGEQAVLAARELDQKVKRGEKVGRLAGIMIAIKDNICVDGMPATCASKILEGFQPRYDATVVERVRREGAIIVGKTNMDEFAMGNTTTTGAFGPTRNPWNLERVAGGSSGGSAAAVAGGMTTLALGTDTGGSVRCPASYCSIFGLKPTYGAVSRFGVIPYANSLEQVGAFARHADDLRLLFEVISGHDRRDSTSARERGTVEPPAMKGLKVARIREFFGEGINERVRERVLDASSKLEELGATVEEVSISSLGYALAAYYIVAMAEASSNLSRYDGVRYGASLEKGSADWNAAFAKTRTDCFGAEVKRRILLGTFVLSAGYYEAYYLKAQRARSLLRSAFSRAFKKYDLLLGPTMPTLPPKVGERMTPLEDYLADVNTVPANLTGVPSVSVPAGFADGLPVGMQLMATHFAEETLFRVAGAYEEVTA
ncbi:MAG: Asp-tRNA(Asn)/Glu-tRNA(Gln) amidotransferase subunit GatA [Nitrososphaerota archaeon]|nr:Asp-tRNA(Asn)/Glu-tRNA(Gln) amidotransferase subunit GatA [Nitrososphaerota archaeon]